MRGVVRKRELEIFLSKVKPHPQPKLILEQYTTPPSLAADILYTATYTFNDITRKSVCDLGCGSGILALGAALLKACNVVAIDIDRLAILTAKSNMEKLGVDVELVVGDIDVLTGKFDTVLQNPPFGVRKRGADVRFLKKALSLGKVVYSIHKSGLENRRFIEEVVVKDSGGRVTNIFEAELTIPYTFNFHKKPKYRIKVDIYRIVKNG
ncbi:MAG: METTL5 family protein [Candidatus Bathyarchaeota archaeon]|nr:METTL5 family protein [Candidatus Bathyarchaeota archaeon]